MISLAPASAHVGVNIRKEACNSGNKTFWLGPPEARFNIGGLQKRDGTLTIPRKSAQLILGGHCYILEKPS